MSYGEIVVGTELKIEKCRGCGGSGAMMQYSPSGKRIGYGPCIICEGSGRVRVNEKIKRETG